MPAQRSVIAVDLADVWSASDRKHLLRTLAWGDEVFVVAITSEHVELVFTSFRAQDDGSVLPVEQSGFIKPKKSTGLKPKDLVIPVEKNTVLRINFVDVQQGDGAVIESPTGKVMLVDGGDNQMFARYLAGKYRGTSLERPKAVECILVTHGDADHFKGLVEIHKSEQNPTLHKRLFIQPKLIYHNGIIKRPSTKNGKDVKDIELLGPTIEDGGDLYVTGLVDDLLKVPKAEMNQPFQAWAATLEDYHARSPLKFRRLGFGDDDAFDFLKADGLDVKCLGESPRFLRRLNTLRGLSHEQVEQVLIRGP